jgi:hypothetical protein
MRDVTEPQDLADVHAESCECKVGRGVAAFDVDAVDEELVSRWCGVGRDRQSLRELATYFNQRLLAAALESSGEQPLDGEAANLYRLLTDDDVSTGVRTQTRRRLLAAGVPVEDVEAQFVSHQTLHTHLTECLGVTREPSDVVPAERRSTDRDRIRALQSRTEVVTRDAIDRLADADALAVEDVDVFVDVTVLCADCGAQYEVGTLLEQGGCECQL